MIQIRVKENPEIIISFRLIRKPRLYSKLLEISFSSVLNVRKSTVLLY